MVSPNLNQGEINLIRSSMQSKMFQETLLTLLKLVHPDIFKANEKITGTKTDSASFNLNECQRYALRAILMMANPEAVQKALEKGGYNK